MAQDWSGWPGEAGGVADCVDCGVCIDFQEVYGVQCGCLKHLSTGTLVPIRCVFNTATLFRGQLFKMLNRSFRLLYHGNYLCTV